MDHQKLQRHNQQLLLQASRRLELHGPQIACSAAPGIAAWGKVLKGKNKMRTKKGLGREKKDESVLYRVCVGGTHDKAGNHLNIKNMERFKIGKCWLFQYYDKSLESPQHGNLTWTFYFHFNVRYSHQGFHFVFAALIVRSNCGISNNQHYFIRSRRVCHPFPEDCNKSWSSFLKILFYNTNTMDSSELSGQHKFGIWSTSFLGMRQ